MAPNHETDEKLKGKTLRKLQEKAKRQRKQQMKLVVTPHQHLTKATLFFIFSLFGKAFESHIIKSTRLIYTPNLSENLKEAANETNYTQVILLHTTKTN